MHASALLLLLLFAAMPALAQPAAPMNTQPVQCSFRNPNEARDARAGRPMEWVAAYLNASAPRLVVETIRHTAKRETILHVRIKRPSDIPPREWGAAFFEAVFYNADLSPGRLQASQLAQADVLPPAPTVDEAELTVKFPSSRWWGNVRVVIFACVDPGYEFARGDQNNRQVRAHGQAEAFLSSFFLSFLVGLAAALLVYLLLALAAAKLYRRQHAEAARQAGGEGSPLWLYALRPPVIAQDCYGHGSLSRFQLLLFTLAVTGVFAYVFARTGQLPVLSDTVLWLLGVTMSGSTLARVAGQPSIDSSNRLWLYATGLLPPSPRIPHWHDIIANEDEIDVVRVQALIFSTFAAVALVVNGTGDLDKFQIPEQLIYLVGISQGVFVAGRALPQETTRRLNAELRQLREAEARLLAAPDDAAARNNFETARAGLAPILRSVFDERFQAARLAELQPGARLRLSD